MYDPATVATNVTKLKEMVIRSVGVKATTKSAGLISASNRVFFSHMLDKLASETRNGTLLFRNIFGRSYCGIGVSYVVQCHHRQIGCDSQISWILDW